MIWRLFPPFKINRMLMNVKKCYILCFSLSLLMCLCPSVCVCVRVCIYILKTGVNLGGLFLRWCRPLFLLFWEGFLLALNSPSSLSLLASELQQWDFKSAIMCSFLNGLWGLNSQPHTCVSSTLLTRWSPWLLKSYLLMSLTARGLCLVGLGEYRQ